MLPENWKVGHHHEPYQLWMGWWTPPISIMYRLNWLSNRLLVQGGLRSHFLCCLTSQRPDAGFPAETSLRKHRAIILWRGFLVAAVAAPHFPRFFWSQGFTFHWGHRQTMIIHDISRLSKDWVHPRRKPPCTIILLLGRKPCFATWNLRSASKVTLKCPLIQLRHTMLSSW